MTKQMEEEYKKSLKFWNDWLGKRETNHLFCDDILRIVNYTDDEWMDIFRPYFKIKECRHFRWDGEPDTIKRRIFILEK